MNVTTHINEKDMLEIERKEFLHGSRDGDPEVHDRIIFRFTNEHGSSFDVYVPARMLLDVNFNLLPIDTIDCRK